MVEAVILVAQENSSGASDFQVALVGAVAGVLGALVGGGITGWVTLKAERERQTFVRVAAERDEMQRRERAEAERRALARGAARVWRGHFLSARVQIQLVLSEGALFPFMREQISAPPPVEDRKTVAMILDGLEWTLVELAELSVANIFRPLPPASKSGMPLDASTLLDAGSGVDDAIRVLGGVAELEHSFLRPLQRPSDEGPDAQEPDEGGGEGPPGSLPVK